MLNMFIDRKFVNIALLEVKKWLQTIISPYVE